MPRTVRRLSESGTYHIMVRGNERKDIFKDQEDKQKFIDILKRTKTDGEYNIYAYCIMDNHAHLVVKDEAGRLARVMKRVNTSYAYYYNKKHQRVGHVFQDRFKSEPIENDRYLLAAIRYVHNNPVQAGMVKDPGQYKWSSYNYYTGTDNSEAGMVEKDMVLGMFSPEQSKAVKLFVSFTFQPNSDKFIEYREEENNKTILGEENARNYVQNYLNKKGLQPEMLKDRANYGIRNEIIKQLKEKSNLSIRQIAGILGVNKNTVQRL